MTDFVKLLEAQPSPNEEIMRLSYAVCSVMSDVLNAQVREVDRVAVMVGIAQSVLNETIRIHPQCPCVLINSLTIWMAQCAQSSRFKSPFQVKVIMTDHENQEGGVGG